MKTVATLLEKKGPKVWSVGPDAAVYDALGIDRGLRDQETRCEERQQESSDRERNHQ